MELFERRERELGAGQSRRTSSVSKIDAFNAESIAFLLIRFFPTAYSACSHSIALARAPLRLLAFRCACSRSVALARAPLRSLVKSLERSVRGILNMRLFEHYRYVGASMQMRSRLECCWNGSEGRERATVQCAFFLMGWSILGAFL